MHDKPMAESEGTFQGEWKHLPDRSCRKCGKKELYFKTWESSCGGYEDEKIECKACGHVVWVEGPDA